MKYDYFKINCKYSGDCLHSNTSRCDRCVRNETPIKDNYSREVKFNIKQVK